MTLETAERLLTWYAAHGRRLPWRGVRDPYWVWVSEIMLQQTQVETVRPYYRRWLRRFPNVKALAAAPLQDVLAAWEGLGYYSRARNLHRAAQTVVRDYAGRLPRTVDALRALPGIGRYTAAAIASIAFGADVAVLDGNVKRVLARVSNYTGDVKTPRGETHLWTLAQSLLPPGRAGDYNQALMDLGATVCTPRAPACPVCPLRDACQAQRLGVQGERPVSAKRAPSPHQVLAVGVVRKTGRVLLVQRPAGGLLGGLWGFPSVNAATGVHLNAALVRGLRAEYGLGAQVGERLAVVRHAYTHRRVTANVFVCLWTDGRPLPVRAGERVKWVRIAALADYPMGKVDRRIARSLEA